MTNSHPEDIEIINMLVQDGKNSDIGFKTLVMKYGESLFRQIHFMTKNKTYTDDILQNVFIKVYQNLFNYSTNKKKDSRTTIQFLVQHLPQILRQRFEKK